MTTQYPGTYRIRIWRVRPGSWAFRCAQRSGADFLAEKRGYPSWAEAMWRAEEHWRNQHA